MTGTVVGPTRTSRQALSPLQKATWTVAGVGIVLSVVAGLTSSVPTLWGLLPIGLFIVLTVAGMSMITASFVCVVSGLLVLLPGPTLAMTLARTTLTNQVTLIGVVIAFGGAVGEVLRRTHVADVIVRSIVRTAGADRPRLALFTLMAACLVLVASLGTLAGALAITAPLIIPVAARLGYTRTATASTMFIGGAAGLALAPFAGSNVAIMTAAHASYLQYLLYGALPLTVVSLIMGMVIVPVVQRRSEGTGDEYDESDSVVDDLVVTGRMRIATLTFVTLLVASVIVAMLTNAGLTFPLVALPVLGVATALAGGLGLSTLSALWVGLRGQAGMFVLFVLLALLFIMVDALQPFTVVLGAVGPMLAAQSPFLFSLIVALLGWVGIPGATAAQVVLLNKLFGQLAATLGVGTPTWIIVLLFASKADTYGPFPNANMAGAMGLARSTNLRAMLVTGWAVLIPACLMYTLIMFIETL